jgi:hydrogenase maturation protein HypF
MQTALERSTRVRRAIRVRGTVQGVGFRPMVHRLAQSGGLGGFVRNDSEGVLIEIEGDDPEIVARFVAALRHEAPPLARIDAIEVVNLPARGERDFRVVTSAPLPTTLAAIPPDAATCDACVRELLDPRDRRYGYPFVNCTDCGPRYTIIRDVPYDRARTTMDAFAMCAPCRAEYEDPADRRFHAEPTACPECGPRLVLHELGAPEQTGEAALARAVALLADGAIVALKGLGGYQLAVDARNDAAVQRLRARKHRPDKPFALMARDLGEVERVVAVSPAACRALVSAARPIVLLPRLADGGVAPSVAPALTELGVMLPATPLHHLLLAGDTPLLVMTSGNLVDEPIAKDDDEAAAKLHAVADALLAHDRAIHTRADDSVVRVTAGTVQCARRARGYAPEPVALPFEAPPILAVGAELKSTLCFTRGAHAYLSQHIGDLGSLESRDFFEELVGKLGLLLGVTPEVVAHDLHPDYTSTRWALARGLRAIGVQHHHAHIASCLAEHGRTAPVIGVAFDGTGCGPAGELWGGEILLADLGAFVRLGHLRPLALAGGETAIREPWRLAVAALVDAGEPLDLVTELRRDVLARRLARGTGLPRSTGAGRWFDAFAALAGVRARISYEAQAAIELDALARADAFTEPYAFTIEKGAPFVVDLRPTVRELARAVRAGQPREHVASRIYSTMAEIVAQSCRAARRTHGVGVVALSGGCFQSAVLTERAKSRLEEDGFEVLIHGRVPPNDGGIALGQAAVAAYRLSEERGRTTQRGDATHVPRHPG